jgi:hypothetical protein
MVFHEFNLFPFLRTPICRDDWCSSVYIGVISQSLCRNQYSFGCNMTEVVFWKTMFWIPPLLLQIMVHHKGKICVMCEFPKLFHSIKRCNHGLIEEQQLGIN